MSDTPIYDQLHAEFLRVDLPAGDDRFPPDAITAPPVAEPRHSKHADDSPLGENLARGPKQGTDHAETTPPLDAVRLARPGDMTNA